MRRAGRAALYVVVVGNVLAALIAGIASRDWWTAYAALVIAVLAWWSLVLDRRLYRARREANRMRVRAAAAERSSLELFATGVEFGRRYEYGTTPAPTPETDQQTGMTP